jgi:CheY-like chemotaxis protein
MEDEPASVDDIESACLAATEHVAIDIAGSAAEALARLDREDYDLIICDLGVPQHAGGLHGRTEAGLAVFERIQNTSSGTPVIVFSGRADQRIVGRFLRVGRQADLFGAGLRPMVQFFPKEDLPDFSKAVNDLLTEAVEAAEVSITSALDLSVSEQRVLQNLAQRLGGDEVEVRAFGSGLSDSKTLHTVVRRPNGTSGQVVAKLGTRERTVAEAEKALDVAPHLPVGVSAPLLHVIDAGAGSRGGAFYQVADEHKHSLFDVLEADERNAAHIVQTLRERFRSSYSSASRRDVRFKEIRRGFISDLELGELGSIAPDISSFADQVITVADALNTATCMDSTFLQPMICNRC